MRYVVKFYNYNIAALRKDSSVMPAFLAATAIVRIPSFTKSLRVDSIPWVRPWTIP